jgi:hypothetical protein
MDNGGEGDEETAMLSSSLAAAGTSIDVVCIDVVAALAEVGFRLNANLVFGAKRDRFSARRSFTSFKCYN